MSQIKMKYIHDIQSAAVRDGNDLIEHVCRKCTLAKHD
jgi:hypothetical protein